jgi:hypothetical protein
MSNKQIRKRAWELFRTNYRGILAGMALVEFFMLLPSFVFSFLAPGSAYLSLISLFVQMLLAPITMVGAASFSLSILGGAPPSLGVLFSHIKDFKRIRKMWIAAPVFYCSVLLMLLLLLASFLVGIPGFLAKIPIGINLPLLLALVIALCLVGLWLTLRIGLLAYAMAKEPEAPLSSWLRASWNAMKHNCWRLARLVLALFFPPIVLSIIIQMNIRLMRESGALGSNSTFAVLLTTLITSLIMCFYTGYPQLALAGFADDLLDGKSASAHPKAGKGVKASAH